MRIKKGTPGKGDSQRAEQFSNAKTPASAKTWDAWCAGEPYWCLAHEHTDAEPGTKACVNWLTDGELKCPRCRLKSKPRTWVSYVPLYRDLDNKAVFVICHETVRDLLDQLFFGVAVYVGRVEAKASIFVKRSVNEKRYTSSMPTRQVACDLTDTLLNIWKWPQYEEWLTNKEEHDKLRGVPKVPKLAPLRSDGKPFSPVHRAAAERYSSSNNDEASSGDIEDAQKEILARAKHAASNGKHSAD